MTQATLWGKPVPEPDDVDPSRHTGIGTYHRDLADALSRHTDVDVERRRPKKRTLDIAGREVGGLLSMWFASNIEIPDDHRVHHATNPSNWSRNTDVITVHDLTALDSDSRGERLFTRLLLRNAEYTLRVICPSEATADLLRERWDRTEHIRVIPYGVDLENFRDRPKVREDTNEDVHRVLLVGDLRQRKQLAPALRALRHANGKVPNPIQVVHVGPTTDHTPKTPLDNPYLPEGSPEHMGQVDREFSRIQRTPGMASKQKGYLDRGDLAREYNKADVLLYPSRQEGFGWPPLEAAASGTPSILTPIPVFEETMGPFAVYLPTVHPDERTWGEAISDLLNQPETSPWPHAGNHPDVLREHAESYRWEEAANRHADVYQEVSNHA